MYKKWQKTALHPLLRRLVGPIPTRRILGLRFFLLCWLHWLVVWRKLQANAVHTVPFVRRCRIALALEDVTKVTAAVGANNFSSRHAEGAVLVPRHGTGNAVEVGWPTATRLEFLCRLIQRRVTCSTGVNTLFREVLVILPGEGRLGALLS